jgi:hypothetical protein
MDQSREDLVDEIPGRGSNGEPGGVLLDEAGSEASQTLDDISMETTPLEKTIASARH